MTSRIENGKIYPYFYALINKYTLPKPKFQFGSTLQEKKEKNAKNKNMKETNDWIYE